MLGNIGPLEIIIVLVIALIVFGPKRLPELGNSLGKGLREFKDTISGDRDDDDDEDDDVKALTASQATTAPAPVEKPNVDAAAVDSEPAQDKHS